MKTRLTAALLIHLVASSGCTCADEAAAPTQPPAPVVKAQPPPPAATERKPGGGEQIILARLEEFCTRWNNAGWMLFGEENPFYSRIMGKVRQRGEAAPAQICRKVRLQKIVTGSRAAVVEFSAEFRDPRLPGQWIPKPAYCLVMDTRSGHRVVYWNDKTVAGCQSAGGYHRRLDASGAKGQQLCEAIYRDQEGWLLAGGRVTHETCLGTYRGPRE